MDLAGAVQDVVDRLVAGGVRAVASAQDVNPPCILVRPPTISYRFGKAYWDAEWTAWAIVVGSGQVQQLKAHSALLDAAQTALGYAAVSARPDDATLADGSTVPIYVLTWTQRIPA